jgi:ATP/ADP translocase/HEAT repeat protein
MSKSRFFQLLFNVHKEEWWVVKKLFFFQFFQGAGIAFFYTAAFSRFVHRFPITELATVFVIAGLVLFFAGLIYNKLEHSLVASKLTMFITIFMALSILVFWLLAPLIHGDWFYYAMLVWFDVLYLLNNLEFWGLAAQMFDVRQSKRLFGVISGGDIPAKFIGYTLAYILVNKSYISPLNLLIVGFLCMALSIPFLRRIIGSGVLNTTRIHHVHKQPKAGAIFKNFTSNKLIRNIAFLSFVFSVTFLLINYIFYADVKEKYNSDISLASFIAMFLGIIRLLSLGVKMILLNRITRRIGYENALLITPAILILLNIVLIILPGANENHHMQIYVFGATFVIIDILRTAINTPVLLSIMQPLPTLQRLRAHNVVKGIMDPFGNLFVGLFLLLIIKEKAFNLFTFSNIFFFLAGLWILLVFFVHRNYLKMLIQTISSRYFTNEDVNLLDKDTLELIKNKIETGSEIEVLYILNILSIHDMDESSFLLHKAFEHPSERVTMEALSIAGKKNLRECLSDIYRIADSHPVMTIRGEALNTLGKIDFHENYFIPLLNNDKNEIQKAAIIAILNNSSLETNKAIAIKKVKDLFHSSNPHDLITASAIAGGVHHHYFEDMVIPLLRHPDKDVRAAAIHSASLHPRKEMLKALLEVYRGNETDIVQALFNVGHPALSIIKEEITDNNNLSKKQKEKLVLLCGRIGNSEAQHILLSLLSETPHLGTSIIKALYRSHYKAVSVKEQQLFERIIREFLQYSVELLHMQRRMGVKQSSFGIVNNSIQLELTDAREILLSLFSFLHEREKIHKIRSALSINRKETRANALELVEMTIRKEFANPFNTLFEDGDLENRCANLKNLYPRNAFPTVETVLTKILAEDSHPFQQWTKACSLYATKKNMVSIDKELIKKYINSDIAILKETATFAMQ